METALDTTSFEQITPPQHDTETNRRHFEPIFKNSIVLIFQLFTMFLALDVAYMLLLILLPIYIMPFDSSAMKIILVFLYLARYVVQMIVVFRLIVVWANELYYVNGNHIICRQGIFSTREKVYECKNIRSISVYQSLMGRIFNYGDLKVRISASGGYNEEFNITSVTDPKRYEFVLGQML
jgi:uncharacterized membrane protein YdbT with pleckstrin-like domain